MMIKKGLCVLFLLVPLLLCSCALVLPGQEVSSPTESEPLSPSVSDPMPERLDTFSGAPVFEPVGGVPQVEGYDFVAVSKDVFYSDDRFLPIGEEKGVCYPHLHPGKEPTFSPSTHLLDRQEDVYREALERLGGQTGLPEVLDSFGESLRVVLLKEGGVCLQPLELASGYLTVTVCPSLEKAPQKCMNWIEEVEPDSHRIYLSKETIPVWDESSKEESMGKSYVFLRVERRGQELVLTQFRSDFVPNETEETKAFEAAFRAFANYLLKI